MLKHNLQKSLVSNLVVSYPIVFAVFVLAHWRVTYLHQFLRPRSISRNRTYVTVVSFFVFCGCNASISFFYLCISTVCSDRFFKCYTSYFSSEILWTSMTSPISWTDANEFCEDHSGRLVSITSQAELHVVIYLSRLDNQNVSSGVERHI